MFAGINWLSVILAIFIPVLIISLGEKNSGATWYHIWYRRRLPSTHFIYKTVFVYIWYYCFCLSYLSFNVLLWVNHQKIIMQPLQFWRISRYTECVVDDEHTLLKSFGKSVESTGDKVVFKQHILLSLYVTGQHRSKLEKW